MTSDIRKAKKFKDKIMSFVKGTSKVKWSKDELITLILTQWIEFLEEETK